MHGNEKTQTTITTTGSAKSKLRAVSLRTARKYSGIALIAVSLVFCPGLSIQARAENNGEHREKIPAGKLAMTFVNRVYVNPTLGTSTAAGYFADIEGVPGPFFSGSPSETTAVFTFTDHPNRTGALANGPLSVTLLGSSTMKVYLNATPDQSWDKPDSFSAGQLIATLQCVPGAVFQTGDISLVSQSYVLLGSADFVFNGQVLNLKALTPHGVTLTRLTNPTPIAGAGTTEFPLVFAVAGSGLSIGSRLSTLGP